MKKYVYPKILKNLYFETLPNGLKLGVIPFTDTNNFYAVLGVNYGSKDIEFYSQEKGKWVKSPLGIAHFLEHKAFEMESDEQPFAYFSRMGVDINASTSFETTKYYIWGIDTHINECLDYLITCVASPYFTDENVAKEQGIIGEEIKMYDDEQSWIINDVCRKMIFNESPVREKIAGTLDSIKEIDKDKLYECYNTFYVPNNMFLIVAGNVKAEEVKKLVMNNKAFNKLKPNYDITRKQYNENYMVHSEYKSLKLNLCMPKVKYAFKISLSNFALKDRMRLDLYLNMVCLLGFGGTSLFQEKIMDERIVTGFYYDHNIFDNYFVLEFDAESDKADIFKSLIDKTFNNIEINENDLERLKRVWIASEIKISDSTDLMAESLADDLIVYNDIYPNRIEIIESLNMDELNGVLRDLDLTNSSFIIAFPKD